MSSTKKSANAKARAKALANTANKDYAQRKRDAESRVKTWQWTTRATVDPDPTWFDIQTQGRGKKLPGKPAKANYQAQQGFDADGRLAVLREYTNDWSGMYQTFITEAPGEIVAHRYGAPKLWQTIRVFTTDDAGRVTAYAWISDSGITSVMFTLDDRGFYKTRRESGGARDKTAFDFDCNDKGKIIRTWWVYPDGTRVLYKGKKA